MTVERLVREQVTERAQILISTEDAANGAGSDTAGSDAAGKAPSPKRATMQPCRARSSSRSTTTTTASPT
jgi:hypothetical protein